MFFFINGMYNTNTMVDFIWYNSLITPPLTPPAWVFPQAWTFLYITIFLAFLMFLFSKSDNKKIGYVCFFTQLILNFSWTPAFFIFKNIIVALIIIILLDIMIFFTIKEFAKVSRLSALFLVPYFLWVLFATYLNIGFLVLNN